MEKQYAEIILGDDNIKSLVSQIFSQNNGRVPFEQLRKVYYDRFRLNIPVLGEKGVAQLPYTGKGRLFCYPTDEKGYVSEQGFLQRG